jgi:hypothetical protein
MPHALKADAARLFLLGEVAEVAHFISQLTPECKGKKQKTEYTHTSPKPPDPGGGKRECESADQVCNPVISLIVRSFIFYHALRGNIFLLHTINQEKTAAKGILLDESM